MFGMAGRALVEMSLASYVAWLFDLSFPLSRLTEALGYAILSLRHLCKILNRWTLRTGDISS
jgi:hypothetical protein